MNLINAGLNGGKQLDLTPIVEKLAPALGLDLPAGTKLGIATGGLLTPGVAIGGTSGATVAPFGGWSGTAWDSVSTEASLGPGFDAYIKGLPVGTIATQLGMRTTIANAIRLPKPTSAQAVAPAAAAAEVEAAAPVADVPAVADAAAADAPAPKRKSRASTRADNDGGKGNPARADRGARRAG